MSFCAPRPAVFSFIAPRFTGRTALTGDPPLTAGAFLRTDTFERTNGLLIIVVLYLVIVAHPAQVVVVRHLVAHQHP